MVPHRAGDQVGSDVPTAVEESDAHRCFIDVGNLFSAEPVGDQCGVEVRRDELREARGENICLALAVDRNIRGVDAQRAHSFANFADRRCRTMS